MQLSIQYFSVALAAVHGALGAAVSVDTRTVANFDNVSVPVSGAEGLPVPTPYRGLNYSGFSVGSSTPFGIVTLLPSSGKNFAFDRLTPERIITADYKGSKVESFDLHELSTGCYPGTRSGFFAPPLNCTFAFTGKKAGGGTVHFTHEYGVGARDGIATKSQTVQPVSFPRSFKNLTAMSIAITKSVFPPGGGDVVQFAIDDVTYSLRPKT